MFSLQDFLLFLNIGFLSCEKILIMHPNYGSSHVHTLRTLAEALTKRNHVVHIVRWADVYNYPEITNPNISEIVLYVNNSAGNVPFVTPGENGKFQIPLQHFWENGLTVGMFAAPKLFTKGIEVVVAYCQTLIENKKLTEKLRKENYKVAIADAIFNECALAMIHEIGVPAIGFWSFNFACFQAPYTTLFNPPSVTPQLLTNRDYRSNMNFIERLGNFLFSAFYHVSLQIKYYVIHEYIIKKHMPNVPHPNQLFGNLSGMLIQTHPALDYPRLLPPTFIEIAGFHLKPTKKLAQEYVDFIESSGDEGVILFSMGFTFDPKYIPKEVFESYFKALGRLKQKVIVKSKSAPEVVPPNVRIFSYVPQVEILAHNKTKLFVSHAGMHGIIEAISYAVPMVAIPIFYDQGNNARRLAELEVAFLLDKHSSDAEKMYVAMNTVLYDKKYKENMLALRKRMKSYGDPMDKAIWLIEHVMEHEGADHLKLSSRHLGMLQYLCIDLVLFIIFVLILFSLLFKKVRSREKIYK